jgi:hypothetical protein
VSHSPVVVERSTAERPAHEPAHVSQRRGVAVVLPAKPTPVISTAAKRPHQCHLDRSEAKWRDLGQSRPWTADGQPIAWQGGDLSTALHSAGASFHSGRDDNVAGRAMTGTAGRAMLKIHCLIRQPVPLVGARFIAPCPGSTGVHVRKEGAINCARTRCGAGRSIPDEPGRSHHYGLAWRDVPYPAASSVKTDPAASRVASMSSSECASETNPASNWEGAKYTPRSSNLPK